MTDEPQSTSLPGGGWQKRVVAPAPDAVPPGPRLGQSARADSLPFRHHMGPDAWYDDLDPGIRFAVKVLHAHGLETGQSCEGGDGHAYPKPTVDLWGAAGGCPGFAALHHLETYGLQPVAVSQVWNVEHGRIHEVLWRVELARSCPERADEWPMFVWGYRGERP